MTTICPGCHRPESHRPYGPIQREAVPGDFAICGFCGVVACFDDELKLRHIERKDVNLETLSTLLLAIGVKTQMAEERQREQVERN